MSKLGLIFFLSLLPVLVLAQAAPLTAPNISGNALFLYRNSNFANSPQDTTRNGVDIEEAEVEFYADVDPYTRLFMIFTASPNYSTDPNTHRVSESWIFAPEELYAESDYFPGFTLKAGKFYAAFGKHNLLHNHVFPMVDAPLINTFLLGDEGLNDVGFSVAYLIPISWYSEATLQYLKSGSGGGDNPSNGNPQFSSQNPNNQIIVGHWKNLLDVTDDLTFEVGGSYAGGKNSFNGQTNMEGIDLTFKWRPASGGKYQSWILGSEAMNSAQSTPTANTQHGRGWDMWGQYQFAERWLTVARYDDVTIHDSLDPVDLPNARVHKYSAALVFNASEFSSYRIEYNYANGALNPNGNGGHIENKIYLQANFTIGSHPAHSY